MGKSHRKMLKMRLPNLILLFFGVHVKVKITQVVTGGLVCFGISGSPSKGLSLAPPTFPNSKRTTEPMAELMQ